MLLSATCWGCPAEERQFGRPIGGQASTPISDLTADTGAFEGQSLVIQGRISSVCQTAGCWCVLQDGAAQLYVSFPTLSIPRGAAGQQCRATGKLVMRSDRPTFLATGIELLPE